MSKTPEEMAEAFAEDWHKDCDYPPEILRHTKKATASVFLAGYQAAKDSACIDTNSIDTGTKMQWISVKDRLPEDISDVLILSKEKESCVGYYRSSDNDWNMYNPCCSFHMELHGITHWMPLPKPPEEDK